MLDGLSSFKKELVEEGLSLSGRFENLSSVFKISVLRSDFVVKICLSFSLSGKLELLSFLLTLDVKDSSLLDALFLSLLGVPSTEVKGEADEVLSLSLSEE